MFVVMAIGASEAEILGVKSQILAEGMSPYDHAGAQRVVIAVVGEVSLGKRAEEHKETVKDSVRRTEVEVEEIKPGARKTSR